MASLSDGAKKKIHYGLDLLATQERTSEKFVKHIQDEIFELRTGYESNIYRLFFIFNKGMLVVLFNGFKKKTQQIPKNEIKRVIKIKNEYYAGKK